MATKRIATVTASGKRYIIHSIDFKADRVFVWGEVSRVDRLRTQHQASLVLDLAAVTIAEVAWTNALAVELFEQMLRGL